MKKLLIFFLALVMLASLAACGDSSGSGVLYEAVSAEMWGVTVDVDEVFEEGFSLELRDGGKAKFYYDGKSYNLKWTLDGETFHAEGGGAVLDGTLSGGVLILENVLDSGISIKLVDQSSQTQDSKAETADTEAEAPQAGAETQETSAAPENAGEWWEGKWYGWRTNYKAGGIYAEHQGKYWDICATIEFEGDIATLTIWDYEESEADAFFTAKAKLGAGSTEHGALTVESGWNYDMDFAPGDWVIDPGLSSVSSLDHMIELDFVYTDPADRDDYVHFLMFLRPWGMDWEDVRTADTTEMYYEDMMPAAYDDWYLPQISG